MQLFATIWRWGGIDTLPFAPRLAFDILGLLISFTGLAMYSECAWCFHPNDALSSCLKGRWSPKMMKIFNIAAPLLIILICLGKNRTVFALNIGTVVGLLIQSRFTSFCQIEYEKYLHI